MRRACAMAVSVIVGASTALLAGEDLVHAQSGRGEGEDEAAREEDEDDRAAGEDVPRYLPAMRSELDAMDHPHACEQLTATRARCTLRHRSDDGDREHVVHMIYSDARDTVYMYIPRYLLAPADDEETPGLLRRLMELNWRSLALKYEWDPAEGEVRLSTVMHTDSNFDRRAFRSLLQTLLEEAERRWLDLARMVDQVGKGR